MRVLGALLLTALMTVDLAAQLPVPVPVAGWDASDPGEGAPATRTSIGAASFAETADGRIIYSEFGRLREIDTRGMVHTLLADSGIGVFTPAVDPAGNIYYQSGTPTFHIRR